MTTTQFSTLLGSYLACTFKIGRISGCLPYSRIAKYKNNVGQKLQFGFRSIYAIWSIILATYFFLICMELLITSSNKLDDAGLDLEAKIQLFNYPTFKLSVFLVYAYFLLTLNRLSCIIREWFDVTNHLEAEVFLSSKKHFLFPIKDLIIAITLFGTTIIEDLLFDRKTFQQANDFTAKNMSLSEKYFRHSGGFFAKLMPYHPCLTPVFFTLDKTGTLGFYYAIIFLVVFSSLCTSQLRMFQEAINESCLCNKTAPQTKCALDTKVDWDRMRENCVLLCDMMQKIADYLAPLFLICLIRDLYDMITNVLLLLIGRMRVEASIHTYASIVLLTFRLTLAIFYASNMDHTVGEIPKVFRGCPKDSYDPSTRRLERFLESKPVGVSLFGTFRITRNFSISFISFIFTTEIILLQSSSAINNNNYKQQ